jgi:hypothetical protein
MTLPPRVPATDRHEIVEARCNNCGRIWSGKDAAEHGRQHAEEECHRVRVTIHVNLEYDGTKEME